MLRGLEVGINFALVLVHGLVVKQSYFASTFDALYTHSQNLSFGLDCRHCGDVIMESRMEISAYDWFGG